MGGSWRETIENLLTYVICLAMVLSVGYGVIWGICKLANTGNSTIKSMKVSETRRRLEYTEEQSRSWETNYLYADFYNIEGHKYIVVGHALCHAETCPCKTNEVQ